VEKDGEVYPLPRAAHFDHEIMRLFQKLGIAEEMEAASQVASVYEFRNAAGQVLMRYDLVAQGSPSGWAPSYMFHQPSLEVALRRLAGDSPLIDMRLRRTLMSFTQDADGVTARVEGPDRPRNDSRPLAGRLRRGEEPGARGPRHRHERLRLRRALAGH